MKFELKDVCDFIDYRGKTPPKTTSGIPLITAKIVKNGMILPPTEFIDESLYEKWMRRGIPHKGDVIITTEAPLGEVALINTNKKLAFAQRLIILEPHKETLNNLYLYYAFQGFELKEQINIRATGTTVLGIKAAELKKVPIMLPPLEIQIKIANILHSLTQKIEINNQINKNLALQLQAIYHANFDKSSHATKGILSDICQYSSDKIPISELNEKSYYSTENMQPNKNGALPASSLPTITQTTRCHKGDVLISNIRPYFKKIVLAPDDCGCSADVLCFVPNTSSLSSFLYETLYVDRFFDYMVAGSKGTKMPRGDKQQIMKYPIVYPTKVELQDFNNLANPILLQIELCHEENNLLSMLRDTLLPQLLSGKLDVFKIDL